MQQRRKLLIMLTTVAVAVVVGLLWVTHYTEVATPAPSSSSSLHAGEAFATPAPSSSSSLPSADPSGPVGRLKAAAGGSSEDVVVPLERGFFAEPWRRKLSNYEELIDAKIAEVSAPAEYVPQLRVMAGRQYRYICITKTSFSRSDREPFMQMAQETQVTTKPGNDLNTIVEIQQSKPWALVSSTEMPIGQSEQREKLQLTFRDGLLAKMQPSGSVAENSRLSLVGDMQNHFVSFPQTMNRLRVGDSWSSDAQGPNSSTTTYKLLGFAEVNGARTAKLQLENRLNVPKSIGIAMRKAALKGMEETDNISIQERPAQIKELVRRTIEDQASQMVSQQELLEQCTVYVDIETGWVIRREAEIEAGTGNYRTKVRQISQRLP